MTQTGRQPITLVVRDAASGQPLDAAQVRHSAPEARLTGVTAMLRADVSPAFRVSGGATSVRGEDLGSHGALAGVAPLTGSLGLRFAPDANAGVLPGMASMRGWLELEGRAAARQTRAAVGKGEVVTPGWGALAIRAGATVGGMAVSASVDNMFNRDYREHLDPVSLLRPGRNLSLRVVRSF